MLLKSGGGTVSINPIQDGPQTIAPCTVCVAFFFYFSDFISFNSSISPLIGAIVFNPAPGAMLLWLPRTSLSQRGVFLELPKYTALTELFCTELSLFRDTGIKGIQ